MELSKMLSTFFVYLKFAEIFNIWTVLLIFNSLESVQISWYLHNFESEKMVVVVDVNGFNSDNTESYLRNINKDDIEVVI